MYSNAGPWQGMDPASDALQYRRADFRITPAVVQMVIIPIFGNPAKTGYAASPPTMPAMDGTTLKGLTLGGLLALHTGNQLAAATDLQ